MVGRRVLVQHLAGCPVLEEDKAAWIVVADVQVVLNAAFFFASGVDEAHQMFADFGFLAGLGHDFGYDCDERLRHVFLWYPPRCRSGFCDGRGLPTSLSLGVL